MSASGFEWNEIGERVIYPETKVEFDTSHPLSGCLNYIRPQPHPLGNYNQIPATVWNDSTKAALEIEVLVLQKKKLELEIAVLEGKLK